jgi:hypothetical protein
VSKKSFQNGKMMDDIDEGDTFLGRILGHQF